MNTETEDQDAIRRYLLGMSSPAEQGPLEERLLTDAAFFEELLIVEDELVDQYLTGALGATEQERFETYFMIGPDRRQKLRFARAMRRYVTAAGPEPSEDAGLIPDETGVYAVPAPKKLAPLSLLGIRNPILRFSLASAALLLVFGFLWVVVKDRGPVEGPRQVLTVALSPGLVRGGGETVNFTVGPDVDEVQLRLMLAADEYQSYRAALLAADGSTIVTGENLSPETSGGSKFVVLRASPRAVPPGDYQLKLDGVGPGGVTENVGGYTFRISSPKP